MPQPLDRILVESFLLTHDENVFRLIYYRHNKSLWRLALRLSNGDASVADDIVQDAWIKAMARLNTFQWRSALRTWLAGIVVFRWREHLRHQNIELRYFGSSENIEGVAGNGSYPDMQMDVARTLTQMPEGYRTILVLHDLEGYRHEDIALMLDIAVGTSKSQLHHARKAFRDLYL